jgi:hypothetical protein
MLSVNVPLAVAELASVTVALNTAPPAVVGVPVIAPADDMDRPAGNAPRERYQE